ncbi:glycoside hydrolase family 3 [bacterium]|nr:MAG: glycoside hydrolase family 3 [bacterium]
MSLQKLVGSMLMFGFEGGSLAEKQTRTDIAELKAIGVRGVILFDHDLKANGPRNIQSPKQLAKLIEDLRNELGSDLIIAIDQEGGAVARLDKHNGFLPTISAVEFGTMLEIDQVQYAHKQANQLAKLGINLNFAPCVDLALKPGSPIIAGKERAFGVAPSEVIDCAHKVIDAHQQAGIGCCIKHFPGHGSSLMDSHLGLCDITNSHIDHETEVFKQLITRFNTQIAVMTGHLMHTIIDPALPASLSKQHTTQMLRKELGFEGVVITDSLDMRAIRDHFGEGDSAVHAINAGADLILDGFNAPGYRQGGGPTRIAGAILNAAKQGEIEDPEQRFVESCDRLDLFFAHATAD